MKKIAALFLALLMALNLCSCGSTVEESQQPEPAPPQPKTAQQINLQEIFGTEDVDITLTSKTFISEGEVTIGDSDRYYILEKESGQIYFILQGTAKNKSSNNINFDDQLEVQLTLDGTYTYSMKVVLPSNSDIVPLKAEPFSIYAQIPKEALDSCTDYCISLGFNNGFTHADDLDSCENLYELKGTTDEYCSADNIQDFTTFKDFVVHQGDQQGYNYKYASTSAAGGYMYVTSQTCDKWTFTTTDDDYAYFQIVPRLHLFYSGFSQGKMLDYPMHYGILEFEVSETSSFTRYFGAKSLEIKSSTGSMKIDENSISSYDYDLGRDEYSHRLKASKARFKLNGSDFSFVELQEILSGESPKLIVELEYFDREEYVPCEIELSSSDVKILNSLLEIYKSLPYAAFD